MSVSAPEVVAGAIVAKISIRIKKLMYLKANLFARIVHRSTLPP